MNILSTRLRNTPQAKAATPQAPAKQDKAGDDAGQDKVEINSAFSIDRDIAYAVGSTVAQVPSALALVTGPMYGIPQIAATAVGGVMAVAGAKEIVENKSLHGRINGGIHLAVGAMAALAPWTGDLGGALYVTSLAALGVKALADRPGNVLKTTASEMGSMVGETFGKWEKDSK